MEQNIVKVPGSNMIPEERKSTNSSVLSTIQGYVISNDKSKLAILKVLLEKGSLSHNKILELIAKTYYNGLPSAWIENSLASLVKKGIVNEDENSICILSHPVTVGKLLFEQEIEIQRILLQKWGAGDLIYLEPMWQYIARRLFILGSNVNIELLLKELRNDAENRIGPFKELKSASEAKYVVIPRELDYMQEFGLIDRIRDSVKLPDFMVEFIFQQKMTLLNEIQETISKLRELKEESDKTLAEFQKIYDMQGLKTEVIHQISERKISLKKPLEAHLLDAFRHFENANCYDTITSSGRAAELLVARIFLYKKGKESAMQIPQMGNQLSKLWKTEVPGQITTPLELVLSLLSTVKWLRDKKGAHPTDITGFKAPSIDEAREALSAVLLATKYAAEFGLISS